MKNMVIIGVSAAAVLLSTALLWRVPEVLVIILIALSGFLLLLHRSKAVLAVYIFGFLFGPLTEIVAISQGAWAYAAPSIFGIPYWLPFVWGAASVVIVSAYIYVKK